MSPSQPTTPPVAPAEKALTWGHAQAAVAGLGALAGLSVYVYLIGGIVAWLRAVAARLPADNVTPAFEDRHLVVLGIKVLALELVLLLGVAVVIVAVTGIVKGTERTERLRRGPEHTRRRFNRPTADDDEDLLFALTIVFRSLLIGLLLAAVLSTTGGPTEGEWLGLALVFAAALAGIELILRWHTSLLVPVAMRPPSTERFVAECLTRPAVWALIAEAVYLGVWKLAAPLGTTVLVLLALLILTHYARTLRVWTGRRSYFHAGVVVVVMAALNLVIVPYLATPPVAYERATVTTTAHTMIQGAYLGRNSNGVYVGTCEPKWEEAPESKLGRVQVIDPGDIQELTLGGPRYTFDVGRRPTLFALAGFFITGDNLHPSDDGVSLDLRHPHPTCFRYVAR
ncbi:MAG TPA: hypothetical protein VHZ54_03875 [Solirubrobacterales bacterium]|jgi:hypothetical protein|nr:hypothetical protein [Solirubrobacterales bacterium]